MQKANKSYIGKGTFSTECEIDDKQTLSRNLTLLHVPLGFMCKEDQPKWLNLPWYTIMAINK